MWEFARPEYNFISIIERFYFLDLIICLHKQQDSKYFSDLTEWTLFLRWKVAAVDFHILFVTNLTWLKSFIFLNCRVRPVCCWNSKILFMTYGMANNECNDIITTSIVAKVNKDHTTAFKIHSTKKIIGHSRWCFGKNAC